MNLYLYNTETRQVVTEMQDVLSYTDSRVVTANGVFAPLAPWTELSSRADCSETLRADWKNENPSPADRMAELEDLLAELIYGGDAE
ncbi:MAG: hypothetical protein E7429_00380 [Ruminococcaceae bacterium]|nr:hypothetical protein [Oscillospiraceae bacterium]